VRARSQTVACTDGRTRIAPDALQICPDGTVAVHADDTAVLGENA
jgi:hypothetical protein